MDWNDMVRTPGPPLQHFWRSPPAASRGQAAQTHMASALRSHLHRASASMSGWQEAKGLHALVFRTWQLQAAPCNPHKQLFVQRHRQCSEQPPAAGIMQNTAAS